MQHAAIAHGTEAVDATLLSIVRAVFERCEPAATASFVLLEARVAGEDAAVDDAGGTLSALVQQVVERAIRRAALRDAPVFLTAHRRGGHARFEVTAVAPDGAAGVAPGGTGFRLSRAGALRTEVRIEVVAGRGERVTVVGPLRVLAERDAR